MKISIIGQGYVGFPLSIQLALVGKTVIGFDNNESKISNLQNGFMEIPGINLNELKK